MGAGIAPQMANAFRCDKFTMERDEHKGDVNKLGTIDYGYFPTNGLTVVNAYTQYNYGKNHADGDSRPLDYEALTLCLRKMNFTFDGLHIGLPQIGCGLAGGDWEIVKEIIQKELKDCDVTIVIYKP
jgi:O-acetyl-ADP-ribose deacetylase (regulator of RNase III)